MLNKVMRTSMEDQSDVSSWSAHTQISTDGHHRSQNRSARWHAHCMKLLDGRGQFTDHFSFFLRQTVVVKCVTGAARGVAARQTEATRDEVQRGERVMEPKQRRHTDWSSEQISTDNMRENAHKNNKEF